MNRIILLAIVFVIFSGAWWYWYDSSKTLKDLGEVPLFLPIGTMAVFLVFLELIFRYAGKPSVDTSFDPTE